jgi:hypothetical protein
MPRPLVALAVLLLATTASLAAPVPKAIKAKPVVRKKIEPRPGEKVYSVEWVDVAFKEVAEKLEQLTGLLYLSKDTPPVKITLTAEGVCAAELFEQINDELEPTDWVVLKKSQSFATVPANVKIGRLRVNTVTLDELPRRPRELVQMILSVDEKGYEAGKEVLRSMEKTTVEISTFGSDKVLVCGLGKEVQKFVDEMGDHIKK